MKSKLLKSKTILIAALLLLIMIAVCAALCLNVSTAEASTSTSHKYKTYGSYTTGNGFTSGSPSNFSIYMHSSYLSGSSSLLYNDTILNWNYFYIKIEVSEMTSHSSFKLTKNGSLYFSKTMSGNSNTTLYNGCLSDGDYELTYVGTYRKNIFTATTTFTYLFRFTVDATGPNYTLKAGSSNIPSGYYVNQQITYSITDANTPWRIAYMRPDSSSYSFSYNSVYTVAATASNNGWWYFYGEDLYNNYNSSVRVCLDTVKPEGNVYSNGSRISNGGYTNRPFYYTVYDAIGISYIQYLAPGASSWASYSSGTTLSGAYGWYTFRAIDLAGNYSDDYRVFYDTTSPVGTLYGGTTSRSSGACVNSSYVKYVASDSSSGVANCYVQMPGASYYTAYASGTQLATEGTYHFYSVDRAGNQSTIVSITLDKTKPTGTLYGDTTSRSSGASVNASYVKYVTSDSNSGISQCYVKMPSNSYYSAYTSGTQLTAEGTYSFYSVDRAGNQSTIVSITLDRTSPTGTVYAGTTVSTSGACVNASYVKYVPSDSNSGVAYCYVQMPNTSYYVSYTSGTQLTTEGIYYFYSVDRASNRSTTISITLDKTKPTGTIYGGTNIVQSGGATNANYVKFLPYDAIGVINCFVKKPGSSTYTNYTSGAQLTTEGTYYFYAVDRAGNQSDTYSVTVDRVIPGAQLYVDDQPIGNNSYTNGSHIKFACSETCYVKKPGETSFSQYVSGTEYYKAGQYVFYGVDKAGNNTGNYTIVIDRTVKPLTVHNIDENGFTDGDVIIDWVDGNANVFAPVKVVMINGKEYQKGSTIFTIDTGVYSVYSEDAAGNAWETEFASTKNNMVTKTLQKEFFEAHDADGNYYTFASYDAALAFAVAREKSFVRTSEWYNETWDTGFAMDAKDSVNAQNGVYFIYKKSGSANDDIAYFTEERLNEVILEYAKIGIEDYFYWEKEFAPIAEGENLYSYSDAKTILSTSIEFGDNINTLIDGIGYSEKTFADEGFHILTMLDEWGNSCDYKLSVVRQVPEILYAIGEGSCNSAAYDRVFRFKDAVKISISDLYDEFAMFNVFNEAEELLGNFNYDDVFTISDSGLYTVVAINHFGMTEKFTLIISRDAPMININENTTGKKLEISITDSKDKESRIDTIEIYKSIDNGETWTLLSADDYGKEISAEAFNYAFRTSGMYKVVVSDIFRTGIDAITQTSAYTQQDPVGTLTGVENGGYTNTGVRFEWTDEAIVRVDKDGAPIDYKSGVVIEKDGLYTISFKNYDGYEAVYSFTIDTIAPEVEVHGVTNIARGNLSVNVTWNEANLIGELYKNGKYVGVYNNGALLREDADYRITVRDLASNMTAVEFTIDKVVDFTININDKGLANIVTITPNEKLNAVLTKNDEEVEYTLGDDITAPGYYTILLTDEVGNSEEVSFVIVEPLVQKFEHNFDEIYGFEKVTVNGEDKRLNYGTLELIEDGTYNVGVVVNGVSFDFTVTVDATAPEIMLEGVVNGTTTNKAVKINWTDTDVKSLICKLNGQEINIEVGSEFTEEGNYEIWAEDMCANKSYVSFVIDKTLDYSIVVDGKIYKTIDERVNKNVTFTNREELKVIVLLNNERVYFEFGQQLTKDGDYEVRIYDDFGNTHTIKFAIDKTAPTLELNGVDIGGETKDKVTIEKLSEQCDMKVYLNDVEIEYVLGDELNEAGDYRVKLTDSVGNTKEFSFTIQETLSGGLIALFVILGVALVGGGVFVILFVKKRKKS